jgi:hypothetical protein
METITPYSENGNDLIFNRDSRNGIAFRIGNPLSRLYNRCDQTQSL